MKFLLPTIGAVFLTSQAAHAVTTVFDYAGAVTSGTISAGGQSFGSAGDPATAKLTVNAAPGEAIPVGLTSGGGIAISIASNNFTYGISFTPDGFNDGFNSSIAVSDTDVFFATSAGSFTWPFEAGNTLRTTFGVSFGQTLAAAPTTYDQLVTALQLPTTSARFVTNGDFLFSVPPGNIFDEYAADFTPVVAAVPVPLSGLLLLSSMLAMGRLRRR